MKSKRLKECLTIALKHNTPELHPQWDAYHHYTFIIQNNKIVDWGTNRSSSPLTFLGYDSHTKMHSEIDAYFKAKGIMDKSIPFEAVNIRLTKTNRIRQSAPCICCSTFLKKFGCKRIWFTTNLCNFANLSV